MSFRIVGTGASIFQSSAQLWLCPVNCVGVMGAGLARQFENRLAVYCEDYHAMCDVRLLEPGGVVWSHGDDPDLTVGFIATKDHWKQPSEIEWIGQSLAIVEYYIEEFGIESVAVPALGAGLGGLEYPKVLALVQESAARVPGCDWEIYPPGARAP